MCSEWPEDRDERDCDGGADEIEGQANADEVGEAISAGTIDQ